MATAAEWLEGARPRTLPAAVSPVLAGSGVAWFHDGFDPLLAVLDLGLGGLVVLEQLDAHIGVHPGVAALGQGGHDQQEQQGGEHDPDDRPLEDLLGVQQLS